MFRLLQIYYILIIIHISFSCKMLGSGDDSRLSLLAMLAFGGGANSTASAELPLPINATSEPSIVASPALGGENSGFLATASSNEVPRSVKGNYVPVGKIYDIGLDWSKVEGIEKQDFELIQFGIPIEIKYTYDADALSAAGFIEEFMVFYYDSEKQDWLPVKGVRVDTVKKEIVALTDHFTPFVITALPTPQGTGVASPPACINSEAPISGVGNAVWTRFDVNFKYYKDRNYLIQSNTAFYDLGLENSLGIATCNGGAPSTGFDNCGSFAEHKNFDGTNYIQFQAPKNITVYLMYDSRGPVDSPWLVNEGWLDTGLTIETTDAVGHYKVYVKDFAKDQIVNVHGNRNGITPPTNINTNLWLVVKPQGSNLPGQPSDICDNPAQGVAFLEDVKGIPGADQNTLLWEIPPQSDIQNVLIRRQLNFPTLSPSGGEEVSGVEHQRFGFTDLGLSIHTTYYYTVFTVNSSGEYAPGKVVELTTGVDQDSDGIKDGYELNPDNVYDSGLPTLADNADSDGDGINDLQEIINQTDPRNPDATKPEIQIFSLSSASPTQMPIALFDLEGLDNVGITHWLLRESNEIPRKNDPEWQIQKPDHRMLNSMKTYSFHVWAKDAAGNISNIFSPTNVTLNGLKYPKFLFVAKHGTSEIKTYQYNLATKNLDLLFTYNLSGNLLQEIIVHPSNKFLIAGSNLGLYTFDINPDGNLTQAFFISRIWPYSLTLDREGKYLYSKESEEGGYVFRTYQVVETSRTLVPNSQFPIGRDDFEMILHPMNDKFISGTVQGSDAGDNCRYSLHYLSNGFVHNAYSDDGFWGDGCGGGVIENSGKYLYTISDSIKPFILNGSSSIAFSTAWSLNMAPYGARQIILHPDGLYVYIIKTSYSSREHYLDTFQIDQDPANQGRLNPVGQSFYIGSGNYPVDGKIDPTGRILYISNASESMTTIELDLATGMPIGKTYRSDGGYLKSALSINNVNEPPFVESIRYPNLHGWISLLKPEYIFKDYCLIGQSANGYFFNNALCSGVINAKDYDEARCGTSPSSLNISTTVNGTAPEYTWTHFQSQNKIVSRYYWFRPPGTGTYNIDYSVTDQPGNCVGGAQTLTKRDQLKVKRLIAGPLIALPTTENRNPTPLRRFVYANNRGNYTIRIRRCEIVYLECGLTIPMDQMGNVLAMRYTCEPKSKIESYNVGFNQRNTGCEARFPVGLWDSWFFKKSVRDLGISSTTYYYGRWMEAVD